MNFIELVEQRKIEARKQNILEVRRDIDKSWVKDKINNHIQRFDGMFSAEEIRNQILENDLVASMFAKDPSKQNITEKLVSEILKIDKLPASGKSCVRFSESGELVSKSGASHSKSADFIIKGHYATQKFTTETGGAQDNQFYDVVDFLKKGSIHHKVAALVDGLYWENGQKDKLIKEFEGNSNVLITSVQELLDEKEWA